MILRLPRPFAALLSGAVTVAGCGQAGSEYQPLAAGLIWRYEVTVHVGDATRRSVLEERTLGRLPGGDGGLYGLRRQDGTLNLLQPAQGGIQRLAVADSAGRVSPLAVPEWVIPPAGLGEWKVASQTGLIERRVDDFEEAGFRLPVSVELSYRMLEGERVVAVPAGTFHGCRELLGEGTREVLRNRRGQITHIKVEQHDFYCPGAGLTLRERSETTDNAIVYNGRYRQALLELRRR